MAVSELETKMRCQKIFRLKVDSNFCDSSVFKKSSNKISGMLRGGHLQNYSRTTRKGREAASARVLAKKFRR